MNKKIAIVILVALLIQLFPITPFGAVIAQISGTPYYDGGNLFVKDPMNGQTWADYKLQNNVPVEVTRSITVRGQTIYFNRELWDEKRIVVYGEYNYFANDFKNATGTLDLQGQYVEIKNKGYYEGGTGEYRYDGFDASGNKYANPNFPVDANSGVKAADKNWIYRIWEPSLPYHYRADGSERISKVSDYNRIAIGDVSGVTPVVTETRKWIAETLPFEIAYGTNADKNAYNYSHVQTRPTSLTPGESVMWHINKYDNKPWYQVFSLDTIKSKAPTPVEAEIISIVSKDDMKPDSTVNKVYTITVKGTVKDEYMYDNKDENGISDDVLRGAYLNREDIKEWNFKIKDHITNNVITVKGTRKEANTGIAEFTVTLPYSAYSDKIKSDDRSLEVFFTGTATVAYYTGQTATDDDVKSKKDLDDGVVETFALVEEQDPLMVEIDAPNEMLDTEKFAIMDSSTFPEGTTRTVELDGMELSPSDADTFISGNYIFPLLGEDKVYTYKVNYDDGKGVTITFADYVVVYTTKPKAQFKVTGTFKENRLITANTDVANVNSAYLKANATITTNYFTAQNASGDNSIIKFGTQNSSSLSYIVKDEAAIKMQMQVTTNVPLSKIQRSDVPADYYTSNVYNYDLFVLQDYEPALIANVWNSVLTRNETLDFYYDAASVDEDIISVNTYKIYYDTNGDNIPETLVRQGNYDDYTSYSPDKLGYYKIVFYAEESFGQPTLSQFITAADKRTFTLERDFYVDNLAPMTKIYTDIEYEFPQADVIVLNDQGIAREQNNTIVQERVNWINSLRQSGIMGSVQVWDLYTYIYDKPASTVRNTSSSYPPTTTSYSSDGYSGTLSRYSVTNNPYQVDNGYYKTVTDSMTASEDIDNTSGGTAVYTYKASGWSMVSGWSASQLPGSISYSSGGYSGTLYKTGGTDLSDPPPSGTSTIGDTYYRQFYWIGHYSGTVSKQVQVWQSNWQWYDDYTGYYSGTIYKNVKQTFTPTFRNTADKYLVYFADSNVNNLADIQYIKSRGSVKVILVGKTSTKTQLAHDYYIDSSKPLADIIADVNELVSANNPVENRQLVLVGQSFALNKADYDDENDPIIQIGYQYVHDANYYDNSTGLEPGARAAFSANKTDYVSTIKTSFSKPGKYIVYRQISDTPTGMPTYAKDSNTPSIEIYVHRKPIADFTLDWDYDSGSGTYLTSWVDKSYDLDHQYSDANKGIVERKIMYRKTSGDNIWIYAIPNNLTSGTYELRYAVKDMEGVWSDENVKTFTLAPEVPMQFSAELRSKIPEMLLTKFTIGNDVEWYNTWSRFPYAHRLEISLWDGATRVTALPIKTVTYTGTNATKNGNDYYWNNINYTIPKGIGLQEKTYTVRIEAISNSNASNKITINRNITLINNTAPTVSFTAQSPATVYEGDTIRNTILPLDADGDRLTIQYYVAKPGQSLTLFKTYTNVQQGAPFVLDDVINVDEGNYQFRVIVTDGNGGSGQADKTIGVNPFGISNVTIIPSPLKAGYWIEMTVTTYGKVTAVSAQLLTGRDENSIITLVPQYNISSDTNTFKVKYQTWEYEPDGVYQVRFTATREARNKMVIGSYEILGSVLDQKAIIEEINK